MFSRLRAFLDRLMPSAPPPQMAAASRWVRWGVALGGAAFLGGMVWFCARGTDGHWIYTLDDAYIHIALAKNLAATGVWGVRPDEYAFCSSSPLWTLLLAGIYRLVGVYECIPGLLNVFFAVLLLLRCETVFRRFGMKPVLRAASCAAVFFLAPLPAIVSTGMEHTMHAFLILMLLSSVSIPALAFFAALSVAARFESLSIICLLAFVLACGRRWRAVGGVLIGGVLASLTYGLYAVAHGGCLLPFSVLFKAQPVSISIPLLWNRLSMALPETLGLQALAILLCMALVLGPVPGRLRVLSLVMMGGIGAHLSFAKSGSLCRYEAYLMVSGLVVLLVVCGASSFWEAAESNVRRERSRFVRLLVALPFVAVLVWHAFFFTSAVPAASRNIYGQQFVMARIFHDLGQPVAFNDLGVMALHGPDRIVDLWGLGTPEVAYLKAARTYCRGDVARILAARGIAYVAVFNSWFPWGPWIPVSLVPVAELRIDNNVICGDATVRFLAATPEAAARLRGYLSHLPFALPASSHIVFVKD